MESAPTANPIVRGGDSPAALHLCGVPFAPGLAEGKAVLYRTAMAVSPAANCHLEERIEDQCTRLEDAVRIVTEELQHDADQVERFLDKDLADVFRAHAVMLEGISREIDAEVRRERIDAILATRRIVDRYESAFRANASEALRARSDDVADLGGRLLAALSGEARGSARHVPAGAILVASRLLPSDTVFFREWEVAGVVVEEGCASGHAALLTREAGIPMVGQVSGLIDDAAEGEAVLVDGSRGRVTIRPDARDRDAHHRNAVRNRHFSAVAQRDSNLPAVTRDGRSITVAANIGRYEDALAALQNGADEIGLFRTEFLELRRQRRPGRKEVLRELREALAPCSSRPCVVRLPDLGGDKRVNYLQISREPNPALGRRGVRLLLSHPELLDCYLGALAELSREQDIRLLVPMVTEATEIDQIRHRLEKQCRRQSVLELPALGAMIETPAAALSLKEIAPRVDFLSIGTNDLTQYTRAADRENPLVSRYFDDGHPAVYRLLSLICSESGGVPVSVCGELASRPSEVPKLLACGVGSLSVGPTAIPSVKALVRKSVSPRDDSAALVALQRPA